MEQKELYRQVLSFANENPACHLATVEEDQPRVRGMLMWYADESGFYFHTASIKRLPNQLKSNPKVEVAYIKPSDNPGEMSAMRVNGSAEVLEDDALEKRLLQERPWLREFEQAGSDVKPVIFRIKDGEAYLWNMGNNMFEDSIERVKI